MNIGKGKVQDTTLAEGNNNGAVAPAHWHGSVQSSPSLDNFVAPLDLVVFIPSFILHRVAHQQNIVPSTSVLLLSS